MIVDFLTSDLGAAAIAGALSLLAYLSRRCVLARVKWQRGQDALRRLGQHAQRAVMATHAEFVSAIQAGREDGELTDDERAEAKRRAMDRLKTYCGWDDLAWILGLDGAAQAASDEIESALHVMKAAGLVPPSGRGSMRSMSAPLDPDSFSSGAQ